jgi:hypothetical protein
MDVKVESKGLPYYLINRLNLIQLKLMKAKSFEELKEFLH